MVTRFDPDYHIPKALELAETGEYTLNMIAATFNVAGSTIASSGAWCISHPEWKEALPLIKAKMIFHLEKNMLGHQKGLSSGANVSATKWLLGVHHGQHEKTSQSIEIEGNVHQSSGPITFRSAMIPKDDDGEA